jgi:hypothetical protein
MQSTAKQVDLTGFLQSLLQTAFTVITTIEFTPPRNRIRPLVYPEVPVRPFSDLYFQQDVLDWWLSVTHAISLFSTWACDNLYLQTSPSLLCRKRRLNGTVLRMRLEKIEVLYKFRCDMIKIPLRSKALSAEHWTKFCRPWPVMVTSPHKWKILERDVKQ